MIIYIVVTVLLVIIIFIGIFLFKKKTNSTAATVSIIPSPSLPSGIYTYPATKGKWPLQALSDSLNLNCSIMALSDHNCMYMGIDDAKRDCLNDKRCKGIWVRPSEWINLNGFMTYQLTDNESAATETVPDTTTYYSVTKLK